MIDRIRDTLIILVGCSGSLFFIVAGCVFVFKPAWFMRRFREYVGRQRKKAKRSDDLFWEGFLQGWSPAATGAGLMAILFGIGGLIILATGLLMMLEE